MNISVDKSDIQAIAREALVIAQAVNPSMARQIENVIKYGAVCVDGVLDEMESLLENTNSWKLYADYPPFFWYCVEHMRLHFLKYLSEQYDAKEKRFGKRNDGDDEE